jgi:hypothetical protein
MQQQRNQNQFMPVQQQQVVSGQPHPGFVNVAQDQQSDSQVQNQLDNATENAQIGNFLMPQNVGSRRSSIVQSVNDSFQSANGGIPGITMHQHHQQ